MIKTAIEYLPCLAWLVALYAFVRPLTKRGVPRVLWAIFLLACASKFVVYERFGGHAFAPEFPEPVIWGANLLCSGFLFLTAFSVVARLIRLRGRILLVLPVLAWGLAIRGHQNSLRIPEAREVEVCCPDLPSALEGYRIVQLADLHVSAAATAWRTLRIVERVNALGADLVVCTGDIVDGTVDCQRDNVEPLRGLKARDGVYFVTGNHEYYSGRTAWARCFEAWGLRFLENECVFPHEGLALAGVPDETGHDQGLAPAPDVKAAFAGATGGEFRVLLRHRPGRILNDLCREPFDLQLSGHTHGGIMPVMNDLVKDWNNGFVRGLYAIGGKTWLYVSPGAGQWSGFPLRFFDDAEITVLRLTRATGAPADRMQAEVVHVE